MQIEQGDNKIVCGVLPRDAEYQVVGAKDTPLCKFSVKAGENPTTKEAIWQSCIVWFEKASYAALFKKGDTIFAAGKIETKSFTGRDGTPKTTHDLNVDFAMKMPSGYAISASDDDCGGLPD